ncbi:MAG: lysylphosphatidylglycerol synthase transmembrane domain-containing protein [Acidobacteriota bacterium]|nr:lysylphosphatidylglycerol synthase transmembrane domain-containing protein [Acidobacteriota bacterium]
MRSRRRRWTPAAAVIVTAAAVWLSVRKTDWGGVREAFVRADYGLVAAAVGVSLLAVVALSVRWRFLLRPGGDVGVGELFKLNIVSQAINILAPGRFGEVARSVMVARTGGDAGGGISTAFALGTVAVEKALDFLVFVVLWALVPALFSMRTAVREYTAAAVLGGVLAAVLAVFAWKPESVLRAAGKALRFLPAKFRSGGADFAEKGVEAFRILRRPGAAPVLGGLTLLVLAGEVLPIWLLFRALGLDVPFWTAFFVLIVLQVGKLPPSLPGKIGVYQFAVIMALAPFGVERDAALGYGIMLHIVTFVPRIVLGLVFGAGMGAAIWRGGMPAENREAGAK